MVNNVLVLQWTNSLSFGMQAAYTCMTVLHVLVLHCCMKFRGVNEQL